MRSGMTKANSPTSLLSVYDGRQCIGFVMGRGKRGFEARSADDVVISTHPTRDAAVAAVSAAAKVGT
jgi:hypothetical protein